jgi:predicted RNase H-like HicB family nuclease
MILTKPSYITAILTEEDNWVIAEDANTHVTTQGKTMDEAIKNLREAVGLYLEALLAPYKTF